MSCDVNGLIAFLKTSHSAYHATESAVRMLNGFERLSETAPWQLLPGGKYVVTRNDSSMIAFVMPENGFTSFQMIASHSDSPVFRIKEMPELNSGLYTRLNTERYGGMIYATWLDRPLSVAGRVIVRTERGIESRLVDLDRDACVIPNVAIHMNREMNNSLTYNPATDLMPLWGNGTDRDTFIRSVADAAGVDTANIVGTDLFLYNRMPASVWGAEGQYISAGRLDDLECVYTSVEALLDAGTPVGHVNVCCVFDNEEVGSGTRQGADSTFLQDVLHRICLCSGMNEETCHSVIAASHLLSADNAHAVHPNHPELSDPVNQAVMNGGVVIKHNANQKYTSDGVSSAIFAEICRRAGVPVQHFANRSDMPGGSTLGNISGSHVSISMVDIGLAQLAMHSSWETAGTEDIPLMHKAMSAFLKTHIASVPGGFTLD